MSDWREKIDVEKLADQIVDSIYGSDLKFSEVRPHERERWLSRLTEFEIAVRIDERRRK